MSARPLTDAQAADLLGIAVETLRAWVRATRDDVECPRFTVGRVCRWLGGDDAVVDWFRRVAEWQASSAQNGARTQSGGGRRRGSNDSARSRLERPQCDYSAKSSTPAISAETGGRLRLVRPT